MDIKYRYNQMIAPIVLFVYNRPQHTLQTLEALMSNKFASDSILYIYADGAKDGANNYILEAIAETRQVIRQKQWCKEVHIIESETNKGLADSILGGVTDIINKYGKIIVLEDDIVTSPGFLQYMNDALQTYDNDERVMHISGFLPSTTGAEKLPETFFLRFMSCWGWATWKQAWDQIILDVKYIKENLPQQKDFHKFTFDNANEGFWTQIEDNLDGKIYTWAIKWYATIFLKKGLCLYPKHTLVNNIGMDGSGVHSGIDNRYRTEALVDKIKVNRVNIVEDKNAYDYLRRFYLYGYDSSKEKIRGIKRQNRKNCLKQTFLYKIYSLIRYK